MRYSVRGRKAVCTVYWLVILAFTAFFLFAGFTENVSVVSQRRAHDYSKLTEYEFVSIEDASAPAGVRNEYRWVLDATEVNEACLCFYSVHQHVSVEIDGETVYTLTGEEDNRIGKSVSSNWATVPLRADDSGKQMVVTLTPLFSSMTDFEPEFLIGSHYSIVIEEIRHDMPQLFVSMLCILLGAFLIAVQAYFILRVRAKNWAMIYLGSFSVYLGVWRITDVKSSPLLFPSNPMILGYISIGMLYLCAISLLLYASSFFEQKKSGPILMLVAAELATTVAVLTLQVLGLVDFKESLFVSHVMMIVTVGALPVLLFITYEKAQRNAVFKARSGMLLLLVGSLVDLVLFYVLKTSEDMIFTPIAFIFYAMSVFVTNSLDTTRKAYVDSHTGLHNKAHWNELMQDVTPPDEETAVMMIDLNNLKQINDTLGHEAGDELIYNFSRLLYTSFPSSSVICRWGGDEFTVMTTGKDTRRVEMYIRNLGRAVQRHNATQSEMKISYALGCALSSEYPGCSRSQLLTKADQKMYEDKHAAVAH